MTERMYSTVREIQKQPPLELDIASRTMKALLNSTVPPISMDQLEHGFPVKECNAMQQQRREKNRKVVVHGIAFHCHALHCTSAGRHGPVQSAAAAQYRQ